MKYRRSVTIIYFKESIEQVINTSALYGHPLLETHITAATITVHYFGTNNDNVSLKFMAKSTLIVGFYSRFTIRIGNDNPSARRKEIITLYIKYKIKINFISKL